MQICVSVFADADLSFYVCRCRSVFLVRAVFLLLLVQIHVSAFAGAKLCLCLQVQICVSAFASADLSFCVCRHRPVCGYADADVHFVSTEVCSSNSGTVAATAKYTLS